MEAINPRAVLKEVTLNTIMGILSTMIADAVIPGSGIVAKLTAALFSSSATQ